MLRRHINILKSNSFFLFGARGTGKSTLIRSLFSSDPIFEIDLLNPSEFEQATLGLPEMVARIEDAVRKKRWIFIDEVQKAPKLLDIVQRLIDREKARFILTGSSARKLKRGGANLLAGRAYIYQLYPFISTELEQNFDLTQYLAYGGLPQVWNSPTDQDRILYLRSYVATYLKEEIAEEQVVRKLEPFGRFLQVAAQASGTVVNYFNIARDVGVSDQTVKTYFQILEDTLLGFFIPAFDRSIRKAQGKSPKFYLFDTGVLRSLKRTIDQPLSDANYEYGKLFEHFVIQEIRRRAEYIGHDYQYSFIRLSNDDEIDLIIDRPGRPIAIVEIKSTTKVQADHAKKILRIGADIKNSELFLLSRDPAPKQFSHLRALHWNEGVCEIVGC